MDYFSVPKSDDLNKIRSEILKYRATSHMNDRERAEFLGLPEGCRMRENAKIFAQENLKLGKNVWIGEGVMLDAMGGLEIGDYCQIGTYVMVWSHASPMQALHSETGVSKEGIIYNKTRIGNNCYIAGHSVIACGVTIGNNVIVSPTSFVDRDLPDNSVYSMHKVIRTMEKNIEALKQEIAYLKDKVK
jgi:acetyltransferase-like isoleucine patch superfamily enzyme